MYIHSFRVRNFMIHQDTSLALLPLTVLVGPNGGGKSALFDAMLNFSMLSRGMFRQAFGPYPFSYRATLYRGAGPTSRVGFEITMSQTKDARDSLTYEIDYAQTGMSEGRRGFYDLPRETHPPARRGGSVRPPGPGQLCASPAASHRQ